MDNMEKKTPLCDLMHSTMEKIHEMVDTNTIVGQPITTPDGVTLIPISKVSFGFGSGGYDANRLNPFESQYAPFGLSGERYKGQKVYEVPMNTDDYFEAMDAWEAERAALAAQEE